MDGRVRNGRPDHEPPFLTKRTGNPRQLVDPETGKSFGVLRRKSSGNALVHHATANGMTHESKDVSPYVRRILTDAALDEIRAHSTQMWLRFLSDRLVSGKLVHIDLVFGCPAYVVDAEGHKAFGGIDFFEQRALFLADAYKSIGRKVVGVAISEAGDLVINEEGGEALMLKPSDEDLEDDDWVWRLSVEAQPGEMADHRDVYCIPHGAAFEVMLRSRL